MKRGTGCIDLPEKLNEGRRILRPRETHGHDFVIPETALSQMIKPQYRSDE